MARLPDIPETEYNDWQASQFDRYASAKVAEIDRPSNAMPVTQTTVDLGQGQRSGTGQQGDMLGRIYGIARSAGLDDEGARVAQAIAVTEGGMSGAVGDLSGGGSYGPYQFYWQGQLGNFANQHGMTKQQAAQYILSHPDEAADWALRGYLGNAIKAGQKAGYRGSSLATYAQQHGQVSVSPERAGQNYASLFGVGGSGAPTSDYAVQPTSMTQADPLASFDAFAQQKLGELDQVGATGGLDSFDALAQKKLGELGASPEMSEVSTSPTIPYGATPAYKPTTFAGEMSVEPMPAVPGPTDTGIGALRAVEAQMPDLPLSMPSYQPPAQRRLNPILGQMAQVNPTLPKLDVPAELGRANEGLRQNLPGYAGAADLLGLIGTGNETELAYGPYLRGEAPTVAGSGAISGWNVGQQLGQGKSLQQVWEAQGQQWDETPEAFPGEKGAYQMLAPSSVLTGMVGPGEVKAGAQALARGATGLAERAVPIAREVLQSTSPVARELAVGETGAMRLPALQPRPSISKRLLSEEEGFLRLPTASPKPTSADAANQVLFDMYGTNAKPPTAPLANRAESARQGLVRALWNEKVGLDVIQEQAQRTAGRQLTDLELASELSRFNPDVAAKVNVQERLAPAIQRVGNDVIQLDTYLTHVHNIDVAAAMGKKAEAEVLARPLAKPLAQAQARAEQGAQRLAGYRKQGLEKLANDPDALQKYTKLSDQADRVQKGIDELEQQIAELEWQRDMISSPSELIRPEARVKFVGWTDDEIMRFAKETGRDVLDPSSEWWPDLDPDALADRRPYLRGGSKAADIKAMNAEIAPLKADRKALYAEAKALDKQIKTIVDAPEKLDALVAEMAQRDARIKGLLDKAAKRTAAAKAKQAARASAKGQKVQAERLFSGDIKAADSARAIPVLEQEMGPERWARMQQSAQEIWDFNQALLQKRLDSGIIDQEGFDRLTSLYEHYTPTEILDYIDDPMHAPRGKSISLSDDGIRRLTLEGTKRARLDPIASTLNNAVNTQRAVMKNDAFNAFYRIRNLDPELQSIIREVPDSYKASNLEEKIQGFVAGERKTLVMPKELAGAVKYAPTQMIDGLNTVMAVYKQLITSRNPTFLVGNSAIDIPTYLIRASVREGGPQNLPKVVKALVEGYADAFRGVFEGTYHGSTADFLRGGGGQSGFYRGTPGAARETVQSLRRGNVFTVNSASDLWRLTKDLLTLEPVAGLGERIELGPRTAMYKLAKQRTGSDIKAVIEGRTVTIDFQQGGTVSRVVNQFVPFFNVGMQAPAQIARAWRENPKAFVGTAMTLLAAPTVTAEAWNRSDPQRARDYDDVPQYIKDQGVVVMLPGEAPVDERGNRHPQFIHIKTREFSPFAILTRELVNRVLGDDPREWNDLLSGVGQAVSPVSGDSAGGIASSLMPLGVSTGVELYGNRDFFRNRMIATKGNDERASALSKAAAALVGARPSQVEYAGRDLGGAYANMAMSASDMAAGEPTGYAPQDQPFTGGFVGRFQKGSIGGRLDKAQAKLLTPEGKRITDSVGITVSPVGNAISNVPLTMDEQATYQDKVNRYTDERLTRLVNDPRWASADSSKREVVVRNALSAAREQAAGEMRKQIGKAEAQRRMEVH